MGKKGEDRILIGEEAGWIALRFMMIGNGVKGEREPAYHFALNGDLVICISIHNITAVLRAASILSPHSR